MDKKKIGASFVAVLLVVVLAASVMPVLSRSNQTTAPTSTSVPSEQITATGTACQNFDLKKVQQFSIDQPEPFVPEGKTPDDVFVDAGLISTYANYLDAFHEEIVKLAVVAETENPEALKGLPDAFGSMPEGASAFRLLVDEYGDQIPYGKYLEVRGTILNGSDEEQKLISLFDIVLGSEPNCLALPFVVPQQ
jgi:hypothetical protein